MIEASLLSKYGERRATNDAESLSEKVSNFVDMNRKDKIQKKKHDEPNPFKTKWEWEK